MPKVPPRTLRSQCRRAGPAVRVVRGVAYIRPPADQPHSTIRIVRTVGVASGVTPAVLFAVHPAWTSASPATTIAAAPPLGARRHTPGSAGPRGADWRRCGADVPAGTAVVGIRIQEGACPVAIDRTRSAVVDARSRNA